MMTQRSILAAAAIAALLPLLGGCQGGVADKRDPLAGNIVDDAELADLLLTAGDPEEAVEYFRTALAQEPDRADFRRGLALSLARARRYPEATRVFAEMSARGQAEPSDRLEHALVAARLEQWDDVRMIVAGLPPGMDSARRHLIDAMLADHDRGWAAADAAYARAEAQAANPAGVLNNWGVSQMSRGALPAAVEMFERALSYDSRLFSAKNNLAIARGLQGDYRLPSVPMTETEEALILNNLGVIALQTGQRDVARGLFAAAVEAHPQHYAAAASRLAALEGTVEN
jgi:Tfp pilus assembly protein PilF